MKIRAKNQNRYQDTYFGIRVLHPIAATLNHPRSRSPSPRAAFGTSPPPTGTVAAGRPVVAARREEKERGKERAS